MALVQLKYGGDARLKRLAQSIIVEQGQEITHMRNLLDRKQILPTNQSRAAEGTSHDRRAPIATDRGPAEYRWIAIAANSATFAVIRSATMDQSSLSIAPWWWAIIMRAKSRSVFTTRRNLHACMHASLRAAYLPVEGCLRGPPRT